MLREITLPIFLIYGILAAILGFVAGNFVFLLNCPPCNYKCPSLYYNLSCPSCPEQICNPLLECPECYQPLFLREAENVADAHYYEKDKYVCRHYAKELEKRLEADGYEAYYCIGIANWCLEQGKPERECWHAWNKVCMYIEAISGKVIEPKDYERLYDERICY